MAFIQTYRAWVTERARQVNNAEEEQLLDDILIFVITHEILRINSEEKKKRIYKKKHFWVHPVFKLRNRHGFYHAIYPTLSRYEPKFKNYMRMSLSQFEELLALVAPYITKQTVIRDPIPAAARLSMTLRFLATGDSMNSMSYQYLVGTTTVSNIIAETCAALWDCLAKKVLPFPLSKEDWLNIARDFENQWDFNHCIGAIDGKHIAIQCPHNAGSLYYNYKNYHSIVLLGICDANYMFTFVDIGSYGRRSDGGIFRDSIVGQKFYNKEMGLPEPEKLTVDGDPMPYVLVGDEAFQLTDFLLRPYPGKGGLNHEKNIYNYRLSRARRTIENTFGIIVSIWRILKKPIDATVKTTIQIVQAIICIHNWLRKQDIDKNEYISSDMVDRDGPSGFIPGNWRKEIDSIHALTDVNNCGSNNSSQAAMNVRNEFCDYFNGEGAIPWQYHRQQ